MCRLPRVSLRPSSTFVFSPPSAIFPHPLLPWAYGVLVSIGVHTIWGRRICISRLRVHGVCIGYHLIAALIRLWGYLWLRRNQKRGRGVPRDVTGFRIEKSAFSSEWSGRPSQRGRRIVQGWAKVPFPGCEIFSGKVRQKW